MAVEVRGRGLGRLGVVRLRPVHAGAAPPGLGRLAARLGSAHAARLGLGRALPLPHPVELPVQGPAARLDQRLEHGDLLAVVGRLAELEAARVAEEAAELGRVLAAQVLHLGALLDLADLAVALLHRVRLQALPGQRAAQEVPSKQRQPLVRPMKSGCPEQA